jgi:sugar (pentulose or hexulose) kinase
MLREQNGYKEETDEEFLSEALTLLRKITDEAAKKILLAQIKAISTL